MYYLKIVDNPNPKIIDNTIISARVLNNLSNIKHLNIYI